MTTPVSSSAPGKVVLSGEYAVLDGAAAIAMAVDARATVQISSAIETSVRSVPDVVAGMQDSLPQTVIESLQLTRAMQVVCDTSDFYAAGGNKKLGLGSSAALTVALFAALSDNRREQLFEVARRLHTSWQDGGGSGVDIACAVFGGIRFYRDNGAVCERLQWPVNLRAKLIWSGVPSSTGARLRQLRAAGQHPSRRQLQDAANAIALAWRHGDTALILNGYPDYIEALRRFDAAYDLDIFAAGHGELVDAAQTAGAVYKPCGAGGGDVGILMADNDAAIDQLVQRHELHALDVALDESGVTVEQPVHA